MPRYKRTRDEAGLDLPAEPEISSEDADMLGQLRNMWEFASLMQYIFLFGEVVKIDNDFDIEVDDGIQDLEAECLKPASSSKLADIGLTLLKFVSSHRGLSLEIFEEYTRRQYLAKAPRRNPFGDEEEPVRFNDLDVFTRIRILQQLSTWTLGNPDRIRGLMASDEDDTNWRMEPLGWDKEDRSYFVLDDNRLYRRTDEPPPPPTPKMKAKRTPARQSRSRATRASKRRRIEDTSEDEGENEDTVMHESEEPVDAGSAAEDVEADAGFGFTGKTWECVAITLDDYQEFMSTIFRSRDPNEKQLRARIEADVVPIIAKRAEAQKQKQLKKARELENFHKIASAKRSSRLADKAEKEKQEREERESEEKRRRDLQMAHEEQERQKRIEEGHESRRLTREQRLRERESKRILHEEELARLEEDAARLEEDAAGQEGDAAGVNESLERNGAQDGADGTQDGGKRISSRQLQSQKERHRLELEKLAEEDSKWIFDCAVCGVHGENLDDGTHSIACDRCNVWQHSKCHGLTKQQAEREDFSFVCSACKQTEKNAKPESPVTNGRRNSNTLPQHVQRQLDEVRHPTYPDMRTAGPFGQRTTQPSPSSGASPLQQGSDDSRYPPVGNFAPKTSRRAHQSPLRQSSQPERPGSGHAWRPSVQHQPDQRQSPPQWQPYSPRPPSNTGHPPPPANGYHPAPSSHYQQHNFAHQQHAMAYSGEHPVYYGHNHTAPPPNVPPYPPPPPAPPQMPPQPPPGMYVVAQTAPTMYFPPAPQAAPKPAKGPGPSKRLMIFHSPPDRHDRPPGSSPVKERAVRAPQAKQLQYSPPTILPLPNASGRPEIMPSPVKSASASPNPAAASPTHQATSASPTPNPASLAAITTPSATRSPLNGTVLPPYSTGKLATDGMSGPWPQASSAIPKKHDQSPTGAGVADRAPALASVPSLVPSPRQKAAAETGTIPVKKRAEEGGDIVRPRG